MKHRLELAQRVAGMGFLEWSADGEQVTLSEQAGRMYGVGDGGEGDGETTCQADVVLNLVHPDEGSAVRERLAGAWRGQSPSALDYRVVRNDGGVLWVHSQAELVRDEAGAVRGLLETTIDVTRRRLNEQALRAGEQRFRSLFLDVPISLWEEDFSAVYAHLEALRSNLDSEPTDFLAFLDAHPGVVAECAARVRILNVNRASLALHGAESNEDLLRQVTRTFTERSYDAFRGQLAAMWRGEDRFEAEAEVRTLGGEARQVMLRWFAPPGSERPYGRVLVCLSDVTELEAKKDELQDMAANLEGQVEQRTRELTRARDDMEAFVYSVSHDLKAPLRAIDGYSGRLADLGEQALTPEARDLVSKVRKSARHMAELIDDLLTLSSIERKAPVVSEVDMKEVARFVFSELRRQEPDRQVGFHLSDLPRVQGDLGLLRQVWENLLQNALKFTARREVARIEVDCTQEPERWVFRVRDNGAGFDMEYVDRLFGVFQRLHYAHEFEGTGVGLAIVKLVLRAHAGTAWAEGEPDVGATFYFELPRTAEVG